MIIICFIQRVDGLINVAGIESHHEISLKLLLDENVLAEVAEFHASVRNLCAKSCFQGADSVVNIKKVTKAVVGIFHRHVVINY